MWQKSFGLRALYLGFACRGRVAYCCVSWSGCKIMIPTLKPGTPNVKPAPQTQIRTFGSSEQVPCKVPEFARNVASPTLVSSPQYTFSPIDSKQAPVFWAHHSELRCPGLVRLLLNTGLRHRSLNHKKSFVLYTPTPPYIFRSSHHQTGSMSFNSSCHSTSSDGRVSEFMSLHLPWKKPRAIHISCPTP